ncbi:MAG TPA: hypothetical protein VFZ31_09875 [Vicinamibacterales bacterium]
MTYRSPGDNRSNDSLCDVVPLCAICDGRMETVYERSHQKVCQCVDCGTTLTVPATAWDIAARKRDDPAA